jgi:hypothetical protein
VIARLPLGQSLCVGKFNLQTGLCVQACTSSAAWKPPEARIISHRCLDEIIERGCRGDNGLTELLPPLQQEISAQLSHDKLERSRAIGLKLDILRAISVYSGGENGEKRLRESQNNVERCFNGIGRIRR